MGWRYGSKILKLWEFNGKFDFKGVHENQNIGGELPKKRGIGWTI